MLIALLKGFGYVWAALATLLVVVGLIGIWMKEGFSGVQETFSPFNVLNYIVTLIIFSPAIGAYILAAHLEKKQRERLKSEDLT